MQMTAPTVFLKGLVLCIIRHSIQNWLQQQRILIFFPHVVAHAHFITICVVDKFRGGCVEPNVVVVHL